MENPNVETVKRGRGRPKKIYVLSNDSKLQTYEKELLHALITYWINNNKKV